MIQGARKTAFVLLMLLLVAGCGQGQPAPTPIPPTVTPRPPARLDTPVPTLVPTAPDATRAAAATATALAMSTGSSPSEAMPVLPEPPLSLVPSEQEFDALGTFQVALGDLDGDGDLDGMFANPKSHNSGVWLNDGRGLFADTGQQLTQYGHGVGLGDWDGDGDLDAFIACHFFYEASKVYLNDGQGNFQATEQDLGDGSISAADLNVLDLDGDTWLDVHVIYYSPDGEPDRVYLGDGAGGFADSGLDEYVITWGDLDGDGDLDLFGKVYGEGYKVRLNNGRGQLADGWWMADSHAIDGAIALADFDGDGDLDALIANGAGTGSTYPALVLWNDGSGQFSDRGQRLHETTGAELGVGDLDGDGDQDVFVANMQLPNEVWLNDGSGRFMDSGLRLAGKMSTKPSLGDLDGDRDLDVFVGSLTSRPEVWFNETLPGGR